MKKYYAFEWPEIQAFMDDLNWKDVGFDPNKNIWFVPEDALVIIQK